MLSYIARISAESVFTCVVKNSVCYVALDKVRTDLQSVITKISQPRMGSFLAPIVGNQLGLMAAVPVSLIYGELVAQALKSMIRSVHSAYLRIFFGISPTVRCSLFRQMIQQVVGFAVGFFAKTYFCNYCMPQVSTAIRTVLALSTPFIGMSLPYFLVVSPLVITLTPAITFLLGDMLAIASSNFTYSLLDHCFTVLFDKRYPLPKRILG